MEIPAVTAVIGAAIAVLGLFGWSHKSIKQRQDSMEIEVYKRTTFHDVREMFKDKMAPIQSEYNSLTRRIDEIKSEYIKLDEKLDDLIVICTKLSNQK